jgi:uncharacterized protein YcnI
MIRSTSRSRTTTRPVTLVTTVLGAAALAVLLPGTAQAHVGMSADTTAAGSYAVLTLAVPHGCKGSPTTKISVQVPPGINAVTPTVNPGWKVRKVEEALKTPLSTEDGDQISSRVAEVVWTARRPLPDGYRDTLSLQVVLPAEAAGQQLAFPTLQTCTAGETGWTQVPAAGQDHDELEHPAPTVLVTAAAAEGHQESGEAAEHGQEAAAADLQSTTTPASGTRVGWTGPAGLVLGALGFLAGTVSLLVGRPATARARRR